MEILFYFMWVAIAAFLARNKKCIDSAWFWIVTVLVPLVGVIWAACADKKD